MSTKDLDALVLVQYRLDAKMSAARYKLHTIYKISPLIWTSNSSRLYQGSSKYQYCQNLVHIVKFLFAGLNKGTQSIKNIQRRTISTSFWLCKSGTNTPTDPPATGKGRTGSSSKGPGKDHFCCPKCGNPCTNVETFVCMSRN